MSWHSTPRHTNSKLPSPQLNNVIIGQITPYGFANLGWKYFLVYVATNISNTVVSYFLFPETKNKTLEEIGLIFGDTNVRTYDGPSSQAHVDSEKKDVGEAEMHDVGFRQPTGGAVC